MKDSRWFWTTVVGLSVLWILNAGSLPGTSDPASRDFTEAVLQIPPARPGESTLMDRLLVAECPDSKCSEYDAGYHWAEANAVTDPAQCRGTESFTAGCSSFAGEDQQQWRDKAPARIPFQLSGP